MQIHTHTGTHTCTHMYACTETHKNTKSETMVDNQKTSKIKNAQTKSSKISLSSFWVDHQLLGIESALSMVFVSSEIRLEKLVFPLQAINTWR